MYNRYIREGGSPESMFSPIQDHRAEKREEIGREVHEKARAGGLFDGLFDGLGGLFGKGGGGFGLGNFFRDLEIGDLILIAILVLMFIDGENFEVIIILGLVLLLGL